MFARLSMMCLCVCLHVPSVYADQGRVQGSMDAQIIDPLKMNLEALQKFCKAEPQTVACEIYKEQVLDKKKETQHGYEVLTANFQ